MGQAKQRGTFEQRQAEAVAVKKTQELLVRVTQDTRRAMIAATPPSRRLTLAAIIAAAFIDTTNQRKQP